jgi:hypothetical protein
MENDVDWIQMAHNSQARGDSNNFWTNERIFITLIMNIKPLETIPHIHINFLP